MSRVSRSSIPLSPPKVRQRVERAHAATGRGRTPPRRYWDDGPDPRWEELTRDYPAHPALSTGTVYSLPSGLREAILNEMPEFFTDEEAEFELALTACGGDGFSLRRPFRYPPLPSQDTEREIREIKARLAQEPGIILEEDGKGGVHVHASDPRDHDEDGDPDHDWAWRRLQQPDVAALQSAGEKHSWVYKRKWGYAGWLVTEPRFRSERDEFVSAGQDIFQVLGEFPRFSWHLHDWQRRLRGTKWRNAWRDLSARWSLETLTTTELPDPVSPSLTRGPAGLFSPSPGSVGMNLLIPWYLWRDGDRDLDPFELLGDYTDMFWKVMGLKQLSDWFAATPKNWGHDRYLLMLQLYVYLELCLRQRYPEKLQGNLGRFELAFAKFTSHHQCRRIDAETVRKVRREMQRRLSTSKPSGKPGREESLERAAAAFLDSASALEDSTEAQLGHSD